MSHKHVWVTDNSIDAWYQRFSPEDSEDKLVKVKVKCLICGIDGWETYQRIKLEYKEE